MKKMILLIFVFSALVRFVNLGYSDYQGDEIKALYSPKEASSFRFFLEQRKGPIQFLVTAGLKLASPDYRNRTLVRFPFALAGLGSVLVFYLLAVELFNNKVALYSSIFFMSNGFFVAFSRLVQYQSLVIFFGLFATYLTCHYVKSGKNMYLILGFVSWAVSILSHYDGVFFMPVIFGVLVNKFLQTRTKNARTTLVKDFSVSSLVFVVLTASFYVPFVLNIAQSTADYWAGRISGDVSNKISSSRYLFSVYQPIYVVHLYTLLGILGFFMFLNLLLFKLVKKVKLLKEIPLRTLTHVSIWFLIPFTVMEVLISIPGTHIYTYLIPVCLLMGVTLFALDTIFVRYLGSIAVVFPVGLSVVLLFLFLQSYFIFADHSSEYPWQNKKFLIWTFPKPTPIFHLSMFGFPYYRHWDEIGDYIKADGTSQFYTTNERVSISRYHIDLPKDGGKAGYYVFINDPQTFTNEILNSRISVWVNSNPPLVQYWNNNKVVSEIYLVK